MRSASGRWDLPWDKEACPLELNPRASTFIVNPESSAGDVLERLRDELQSERFVIDHESKEDLWPRFEARYLRSVVKVCGYGETLVVNTFGARARKGVQDFIGGAFDAVGFGFHELPHQGWARGLKKGLVLCGKTGMPKDRDRIYPETDYELKKGPDLVGRARLSYYNSEMNEEGVPTIELFEIRRGYRRHGYGSSMLEAIEFDMKDLFFSKIWATNMQDYGFFERMGYESDLEEGWKELA